MVPLVKLMLRGDLPLAVSAAEQPPKTDRHLSTIVVTMDLGMMFKTIVYCHQPVLSPKESLSPHPQKSGRELEMG
ncbi:hypothetical protein Cob_v004031 [Colletotrichum orbiculare MAFF 240422]|uniref:Uncharacterized protein n=1 Tax=Colletotrichum orbiculare (strain 104-T / ATCC 96160 / CBS 514.97 / LARS 414 / MAFF 240422) TaxID=1213857 RepID=A0A484FZ02_COLOR|nr:hypothetical protein Cob_v004031 [Colletotrichum orbiculare MAFF 240422]